LADNLPNVGEAADAGSVVASPEPTIAPEPDGSEVALPNWLSFALLAALLVVGAGLWAWRRRRRPALEPEAIEVAKAAETAPLPTKSPVAEPRPVAKRRKRPQDPSTPLRIEIEPLTAATTLVNLRLRYVLVLRNTTNKDVSLSGYANTIFAGSGAQEATIREWLVAAPQSADISGVVPAKGELRINRELAVPLGQLSAMQVRGRAVLIPVLLIALGYRHAIGLGQLGRAFVIGKPRQSDGKLNPLPLDQGMGGFGVLAARDTGISHEN
jgi:hypothetical protein